MEEELIKQIIKEETEKVFLKTPLVLTNPSTDNINYVGSTQTGHSWQIPSPTSTTTVYNPKIVTTGNILSTYFASGKEVQDLHILVLEQAEQIRVLTEAVNTLLDNKIQDFNKKKDE